MPSPAAREALLVGVLSTQQEPDGLPHRVRRHDLVVQLVLMHEEGLKVVELDAPHGLVAALCKVQVGAHRPVGQPWQAEGARVVPKPSVTNGRQGRLRRAACARPSPRDRIQGRVEVGKDAMVS